MPVTAQNFAGLDFATWGAGWPPDPVGDVGPNHYVEAVSSSVGIFSKTGVQQAAFTFDSLWAGAGTGTSCDTANIGYPNVVYDPLGDRWLVSDLSWANVDSGPYYECLAVSKTGDPVTGGWWLYAIRVDDAAHNWLPDDPKMGVWPDGLYMSADMFDCSSSCTTATPKGVRIYAFNLVALEAGQSLQELFGDLGTTPASLLPGNLRGATPPVGTPEYFIGESPSLWEFQVYKFHIDWVNTGSSTFTGPTAVSQQTYTLAPGPQVAQPGTTVKLDSVEDRLMMQAQYRNISGVESLWVAHTVGTVPLGVQWAQINVTGGTVASTPVQQQIWQNVGSDSVSRWMPSLAVDRLGDMAVGYSAGSSTLFPSIRYAGRLAGDPVNTLGQGEATMFAGSGSQTNISRWGYHTAMSVDPVDDCTFWYVGEYYATSGSNWQTRIGSFRFPGCTAPSADLSLTNGDSPDPVTADSPVTYTVRATNNGPADATNVVVTDTLPTNVMLGSVTPSQGSCTGTTTLTCNLGALANGANATVTIFVTPVAPGSISNSASASATQPDPSGANNSATQSTTVAAQKKTAYISVTDAGSTPSTSAVAEGTTVQWNFFGPNANSVTDTTGMGLFSSGPHSPVSYFRYLYVGAGQYGVADSLHHVGLVKVALKVALASGTVTTARTITWSSTVAPLGFVFDVQVLRPGTTIWTDWRVGESGRKAVFTPDAGTGTYRFRSRMRDVSGGAAARYSAAKKITAS
jgi:uncharacterized repeat protein (TIGR01451 family)